MFGRGNSSNSSSQDDDFDNQFFKKVNYQGNISDSSDSQGEDSASESSKKAGLERKMTNNKSTQPLQKSKNIKKNCESAKMSRQRKKVYLDLLEQKAQELKTDIQARKLSIRQMNERILSKFQRSNRDKHRFLVRKLALSKQLLALSHAANSQRMGERNEEVKGTSPETIAQAVKEEVMRTKPKRRRGDEQKEGRNEQEQKAVERERALQLGINAYMYEFGVKGCLRSDVIERSKHEWLQTLQRSKVQPTEELTRSVRNMKDCLERLEGKTKKLDFHLRELKERVKQKFVVQFLVDREFFIHQSADTIYKNTPLPADDNASP